MTASTDSPAAQETRRQHALDRYHMVDSLPATVYDDLVNVAAALCGTPIAVVSLIDRDRQWFKARVGLDDHQTTRDTAVCDHAIRQPDELLEEAGEAPRVLAALVQDAAEALGAGHQALAGAVHGDVAVALQEAHQPADPAEDLALLGRRDERHPRDVHGLVRPSEEHPQQALGHDRHRGLQGFGRQEDVDRPVRRQVRLRAQGAAQAEADGKAEVPVRAQADRSTEAETDTEAHPHADAVRAAAADRPGGTRPRWR